MVAFAMTETASPVPDESAGPPTGRPLAAPSSRWWSAVMLALAILVVLGWLLARLVWLPFYCGLFFFLVAGLLAGGVSFRVARPARPLSRGRIVVSVCLVALSSSVTTLVWEYRNVASTIGGEQKFPEARNRAVNEGRPVREIERLATGEFVRILRERYSPGGVIGYVLWATGNGEMDLTVRECDDHVSINHRGIVWPLRTSGAALLLAAGLWLSFESLRSPAPVSNILAPGEEAEE